MTPLTEQERAEALEIADGLVGQRFPSVPSYEMKLARALLDADQRITDLTRERDIARGLATDKQTSLLSLCKEALADREAQLAACREALAFYGDPSTYEEETAGTPNASGIYETTSVPIFDDHGDLARRALSDGGSET